LEGIEDKESEEAKGLKSEVDEKTKLIEEKTKTKDEIANK